MQSVPDTITVPNYLNNNLVSSSSSFREAEVKSLEQINKMRKSCRLARYILDKTSKTLRVFALL